ncbi:RING-type domain-containing protein [Fusarium sp. Ph1]|nr:RING-type domain-containing protein [Fusarium sp. Ph1]
MSPSNPKLAAGGAFHTFQGVIPKKHPTPSSSTRPRVAGARRITTPHACTECKRRKIRCDGKLPCGQCITSRAPKSCSYDKHRQRLIPSRKALDTLSQSLEECRSVLRRLYPNHEVSTLLPLTTQELIELLAQPQSRSDAALPSPPLETAFLKQETSPTQSEPILPLPSSLEADLDTLIGELEFEIPSEQFEGEGMASLLAQQSWWDFNAKQWDSVQAPSFGEGQVYGAGVAGPSIPTQNSVFKDEHSIYNSLGLRTHCLLVGSDDMEHTLICNNLQCRQELGERALVTTCSHIFCLECAERLGVTGQETERRNTCPACHSHFNNPDDAVITNLSPSEEYKTTILSGLSPNIVMECAGRALSFWAYQTTQDMYYQQYLYKTLAEKYSALNIRLEKTVSDANTEIDGLQHRLTGMTAEQDALRRKNEEIGQAYKEKSRKVLQLQELYNKVKSRAELGKIQKAASDAVDLTLETPSQLNQGIAGNNGVPESDNTPAFSQRRANGSGMNTGMPRSYPAVTRESTLWPRVGGASRLKLSP